MQIELSVVIPAFNEAHRLGPTLEAVSRYLEGRGEPWEVIVVDDGSTDATAEVVEGAARPGLRLIRQPANRGKGAAVQRGVAETRGRRVLFADADQSVPISKVERLEERLADGAKVVIASRGLASSKVSKQPLYRQAMGKTFNRLVRLLGFARFRDTQCGFKLFEGDVGRHLFSRLTISGFAFDVELLYLAQRLGLRVDEVPVEWVDAPGSRVDPVLDSLRMLRDILLMRWRHRPGAG